jgi:hypothetical protein
MGASMRRTQALAIIAVFFATSLFAQNRNYSSLVPKTAKSMAMGGVFSAVPTLEFSFFGNPAAFASEKTTLLLPSLDAWAYLKPDSQKSAALLDSAGSPLSALSALLNCMGENGGTGGGLSAGIGFAGKGLGLGLFLTSDNIAEGPSPEDAVAHSETEVAGIIGLGAPIKLGTLRLSIGGDIRPFYRVGLHDKDSGGIDVEGLLDALAITGEDISSRLYADSFFGLAADVGATLELGSITLGLSIRDIAPSYPIATTSLQALEAMLASGDVPSASSSSKSAILLPDISAGLSWAPKLVPGVVDPHLYLDLSDPISVIENWAGVESAVNLVHAGAEIEFLRFFTLRGGFNRGWFSLGAGIKLLFIDLNAAIFTEGTDILAYDQSRSGIAVQASIRF